VAFEHIEHVRPVAVNSALVIWDFAAVVDNNTTDTIKMNNFIVNFFN
jgi:hypothetical protein